MNATNKEAPTDDTASLETSRNSEVSQEWEISPGDINVVEHIGAGRFGSDQVFRGYWHGDVAVRKFNLPDDIIKDATVEELFREEVANLRKVRHENLETFMGACVDPSKFAIVTVFCKGDNLHDQIHHKKIKFNLNKIILIAQQICLAMGYLHSKNIVHKNLTSRNVFFDNGQVVVGDYGLYSLKTLCRTEQRDGTHIMIPKNWLCYLAPEIMRKLNPHRGSQDIAFTFSSDVYALGTIWYELIAGDMPYKNSSPVITIWQVGRGLKQPLTNIRAPREIKNILLMCWSAERPKFPDILDAINNIKLPTSGHRRGHSG
jgi:kinase suppressor of Ras 2